MNKMRNKMRWAVYREDEDPTEARFYEDLSCYRAADAAADWAGEEDIDSYRIVDQQEEPVVIVEDLKLGTKSKWKVFGEAEPHYYARPA